MFHNECKKKMKRTQFVEEVILRKKMSYEHRSYSKEYHNCTKSRFHCEFIMVVIKI